MVAEFAIGNGWRQAPSKIDDLSIHFPENAGQKISPNAVGPAPWRTNKP